MCNNIILFQRCVSKKVYKNIEYKKKIKNLFFFFFFFFGLKFFNILTLLFVCVCEAILSSECTRTPHQLAFFFVLGAHQVQVVWCVSHAF
jgi:hypothetical protein